jgi:folate-binding protein YgfZ
VQAVALAAWLDGMRFARRVDVSDISGEYDAVADLESDSTLASPGIIIWRDPWPVVADGSTRYGPPADEHPGEAWNLRLALLPRGSAESAISNAGLALAGASALDALRIAACRPVFSREVDASSIPHELDWLRTAVHLRKGCYRGQEAVAHVHNLGRPPRRLVLLHLDGSAHEIPEPGSAVCLAATGETVGRLTSSAMHHELGPIGLAVIRRTTPEGVAMMVGENTSASAETVVNTDGTTPDRPAPRGPLTRGLMAPTRSMPAAGGASVRIFGAKP